MPSPPACGLPDYSRGGAWGLHGYRLLGCPMGLPVHSRGMIWLANAAYVVAALFYLPVLLWQRVRHGRTHLDWSARFGHGEPLPPAAGPRILVHAVSVGEINATRFLIKSLREQKPGCEVVVATTTDTGFARAKALFADAAPVVRYPVDFSWAVRRFLDRVRPDAIALVELEVWPNMMRIAAKRGIPVAVVNGRLSARSARRYGWIAPLVRPVFAKLAVVCAQSEEYAARFRALGAPADRVFVTGNMKWDTAEIADDVPGAAALADALGIDRSRPLIVAGSTAPGEERLVHEAAPAEAQVLCAPRRPEWFDAAARIMTGCARRSTGERGSATGRFLLDTIGELRAAYALADVVVVGRTFVDLGGSDMMEPIALGKATVIGPHVSNFAATVEALQKNNGVISTTERELATVLAELLRDPDRRAALAARGRDVIRQQQGASARNAELVHELISNRQPT